MRKPDLFPLDCLNTARNWGNLEFSQGNWDSALERYQLAMIAIERTRQDALSEARREQVVADAIYVYENAIQAAVNLEQFGLALEIAENARSKRLRDLMATPDLYRNGELPAAVRQLVQELEDLDAAAEQERQQSQRQLEAPEDPPLAPSEDPPPALDPSTDRVPVLLSSATARLNTLAQRKQAVLDRLRNLDAVTATLNGLPNPRLSDYVALLADRPRTALLSFYSTDDATHGFILRHGAPHPSGYAVIGQGFTELQQWLREQWQRRYQSDRAAWVQELPKLLAEVSQRLDLDRLVAEHLQEIDELVIIPHLFLHQIPFAALPLGQGEYLGERFVLRYAPSAQVLKFCRDRGSVTAQTYGSVEDATDDLSLTRYVGDEIEKLFGTPPGNRLQGSQASTRQAYRALLGRCNNLVSNHHAGSHPEALEASLQLGDGFLAVSQLIAPTWRFRDLDEVFLSCCETGFFSPASILDEPLAIGTGFLCAGARAVIATHWSVDLIPTVILSVIYHQNRKQGQDRPRSLQAAQQSVRLLTGQMFKEHYAQSLQALVKARKQSLYEQQRRASDPKQVDEYGQMREKQGRIEEAIEYYSHRDQAERRIFDTPDRWAAFHCQGMP